MKRSQWSLHMCQFDKECRQFDPPLRLYVGVPGWHLTVALTPNGRVSYKRGPKPARYQGEGVKTKWVDLRRRINR